MKIELRGVRKLFGRQEALAGIDLVIPEGQRVAIVGPNGSGKSTLLRAVMGLVSCEGTVRLDGVDPFRDRHTLAREMAYVPQIAPQLGATVSEVIRAVTTLREIPEDCVRRMADRLDLDTRLVADKPFRSLSGGMKQKLLLALAMASGATLLILDEPTASLDAPARERFAALLDAAARGTTVLLCSHRVEDVQRQATRVVQLGEGRIVRDERVPADNVVALRPRARPTVEEAG